MCQGTDMLFERAGRLPEILLPSGEAMTAIDGYCMFLLLLRSCTAVAFVSQAAKKEPKPQEPGGICARAVQTTLQRESATCENEL